jgi:hypothetical protein
MTADSTTTAGTSAVDETDRMVIINGLLAERSSTTLRDFLAERWRDGRGMSWDRVASELRVALDGTGYQPPRETVIKYALRYGVITERPTGQARVRRRPDAS